MGGDEAVAGILKTKLYAPRLPDIIPRERLLRELAAARKAKLTTIVAGAGYGKSTLAAAFLAIQKMPFVWYQLEETDRDVSEFITYLVAGIRRHKSGFGDETINRMLAVENIARESRVILTTLISEMDAQITDDLFIILDDFQQVNKSPQIISTLNFLLGHLPPFLHLMVVSRAKPDLDLPDLAARRELVEIGEADLRFSPREVSRLFADIFGLPLEDDDARNLCRHTEGWITGLVLLWLAVKDRGEGCLREASLEMGETPARVAEYLSRMVFESQSRTVREFTMKTSVLPRMNPGFCDRLLDIGDSGAILEHLADSRLFTIPLDERGECYRYHHLLRAFLRERLSETYSPEEINELNRRAAALWGEAGEPEQALSHCLEAGDFHLAAGILNGLAPGLMNAGRISFLRSNLDRLPEEVLLRYPWLVFDLARISDLIGEYVEAIRLYKVAAPMFEEICDLEGQARSLINIGFYSRFTGRPEEATDYLIRGMDILPPDSHVRRKAASILSSEYALRGMADESLRFQSEALEGIDGIEDEASRVATLSWCANACFHRGDFLQAYELYSTVRELAERIGHDTILPLTYVLLSGLSAFKSCSNESLDYAEKGISLAEKLGNSYWALFARYLRSLGLAVLGDQEESLKNLEAVGDSYKVYGTSLQSSYAEYVAGWVYMVWGDHAQSIAHMTRALRIAEAVNSPYHKDLYRLLIIWQSAAELHIGAAREEVVKIATAFAEPGVGSFMIPCDLVMALLEVIAGNEGEAREAFEAALEQSVREQNTGAWKLMWSGRGAPRLLPLAADVFSRGEHLEYMAHAFASVGTESLPYLKELEKSGNRAVRDKAKEILEAITRETAEPLEILMLGPFEITRGGKRIAAEDWRSKKALTLTKYLAAQDEGRLVPRDVLMELLWPDSSQQAAQKSLNVALTSLRRTLEPEGRKGESSYLVVSGDALRLELGGGGWVDFKLFRKRISKAEEARRSGDSDLYLEILQEAEELYQGDFLSEDLYEDWCRAERDSLHGEYLSILLDISVEYLRRQNSYAALRYMVKAIEADPGREDLYRNQMEICARMGDRAGMERAYKRLSDYLRREFDLEPSPETVELYRELRGD